MSLTANDALCWSWLLAVCLCYACCRRHLCKRRSNDEQPQAQPHEGGTLPAEQPVQVTHVARASPPNPALSTSEAARENSLALFAAPAQTPGGAPSVQQQQQQQQQANASRLAQQQRVSAMIGQAKTSQVQGQHPPSHREPGQQQQVTVRDLRQHAAQFGIEETLIEGARDGADPKGDLIKLMEASLRRLTVGQLRQRAAQYGTDAEKIEDGASRLDWFKCQIQMALTVLPMRPELTRCAHVFVCWAGIPVGVDRSARRKQPQR